MTIKIIVNRINIIITQIQDNAHYLIAMMDIIDLILNVIKIIVHQILNNYHQVKIFVNQHSIMYI